MYYKQTMIHPAQGVQRGTIQEYLQSPSAVIKEAQAKQTTNYTWTPIQRSGCFHQS